MLDLLDSGCLSRTPTHCHSVVKPQRPHPSKCPLFPIRKERTDRGHTGPRLGTSYTSGPTVLYSCD